MAFDTEQGNSVRLLGEIEAQLRENKKGGDQMTASIASVKSASEVCKALFSLRNSIVESTAQAKASADESSKQVLANTKLTSQLNTLTMWVIGVTIVAAFAAVIQAGTAVYQSLHPSDPQVLVVPFQR